MNPGSLSEKSSVSSHATTAPGVSFWPRFAAHLIDFLITNALELGLGYALAGIVFVVRKFILKDEIDFDHAINPMLEQGIGVVFGLWFAYYYYVLLQIKNGTTIGKKLFSIYVVDYQTGLPMSKKQTIIRLVSYLPSYLLVGCGFLMAAFHPERRALHDLIAGTICVRKNRSKG